MAVVEATNDLRLNMRDVRSLADGSYVAHTAGRNSFAAGVAIAAMRDATPQNFGAYPMTQAQIDAMSSLVARIAATYGIPIDREHVMTHAEAAVDDGYFGSGEGERWDIARLAPRVDPLTKHDAREAGDALRARIRA